MELARIGQRAQRFAASLALAALLAGCGAKAPTPDAEPLAVEAVAVVMAGQPAGGGDPGASSYPVALHRDREARLGFRSGGVIRSITVRPGDRLAAGATVASVDAGLQAAAVARAAAEVARLERAAGRYGRLAEAGAVGEAQALDSDSALTQARAALAAARHDLAETRIRMPFAGTVLTRHAEVGEVVGPGTPVATVIDNGAPLVAVADIPAERAARLGAGARAWLHVPGRSTPVAARLRRVPGGADAASGTARVELLPENTAGLLSGMTGSVSFDSAGAAPNPGEGVIPAEALLWARGGKAGVFVIDGQSRARGHEVRLLGIDGDRVRIAGLAAGTRVITIGAGFAREGQWVEVPAK